MVLEKVKFWKKHEEETPLEESAPQDLGMSEEMPTDLSMPKFEAKVPKFAEGFISKEGNREASGDMQKDIQLILSKLDTIKAIVDSLDHRIERLERIAESE